MKMRDELIVNVSLKCTFSFWEALKCRLVGGKIIEKIIRDSVDEVNKKLNPIDGTENEQK